MAAVLGGLVVLPDAGIVRAQCQIQRLAPDETVPPQILAFGRALAADADRAVISAWEGDPPGDGSGVVFVYRWVKKQWVQEGRLSPPDDADAGGFGQYVAISRDYAAVSAGGPQTVYIFDRTETGWVQHAKLVSWSEYTSPSFPSALSLSGGVVVIGDEDDDEAGTSAGAVYVYRRTGTEWIQEQKLLASDALSSGGAFGRSVAADGDYILVGDPGHTRNGQGSGWVYVFHFDGTRWIEEDMLIGSDTALGDSFGYSVVMNDDCALIGSPYHDHLYEEVGAVYAFRRGETGWVQEAKLIPQLARAQDLVGFQLAIDAHYALLGDNTNDLRGEDSGIVYVFEQSQNAWFEHSPLQPVPSSSFGLFGSAVALSSGRALVTGSGSVSVYNLAQPCHSLQDYASLQACFGASVSVGCEQLDGEPDGDIDMADYRYFLDTFVGP